MIETPTPSSPAAGGAAKPAVQPDPQETREWLDALDGVDGWISARVSTLATAHRRFEQLQRTAVIEHAVDCIRAKQHPLLSAEHARHALEIMLKAIKSAKTGQTLDLTTSF